MPAIARLGDPISCGDTIGQGSGNVFMNGLPSTRIGDLTSGHCYPAVPLITGSPNVFANNIPVTMIGSAIPVHCCGDSCHSGACANGSPNIFVNDSTAASAVAIISSFDKFIQPGITRLQAAQSHDDDPKTDPRYQQYRKLVELEAGVVSTTPVFIDTPPTPTIIHADIPTDCADIESHQGRFVGTFMLTPNYSLAQLTTNTLVSNYPLRAQAGLTEKQIVCNLRMLCVNVLEPLLALYGSNMTINSGYRWGIGSEHYTGNAVDISFKNLTTEKQFWDRANELKDTVNFNQFIFEQQQSIWYHISYKSTNNKQQLLTKPRGTRYFPGLKRIAV